MTRQGDQLAIEGTQGMLKQRLYRGVDGRFFVKISRLQFSFERDSDNKVTGLVLHGPDGDITGIKLPT